MPTPRKPALRRGRTSAPGVRRARARSARARTMPLVLSRFGLPMDCVPAATLKNHLGAILRQALIQGAVVITRHNEAYAMLLSVEEYQKLLGYAPSPRKAIKKEFDALVAQMQTKKSKRAVRALFRAKPADLARAARNFRQSEQSSKLQSSMKRHKVLRHGR